MRDWLFKQWWRVNHARNVVSLIFWIAMLVGIWVPLIQIVVPVNKWVLVIVTGVGSLFAALFLGYAWDKLGLWRDESHQAVKRSYGYAEPLDKEKRYLIPLQLETAKAVAKLAKDKSLEKKIKEVEEWLAP